MARPSAPRPRAFGSGISAAPVVFLSYSHADAGVALTFREALANSGLEVTVDVDHLQPGEDIAEFGREAVRQADATICLVSTISLKSAWVMFEAMTTLQQEQADGETRLITCATDQSVLDSAFGLEITRAIDGRLEALNALITEYLTKQLDFNDLSIERSRWMRMRAGFGDVLDRARNSLTLILTPDNLRESAERIADHVRARRGQPASRQDPRDIRIRADELRQHLYEAKTDDALDRLLDFVREFSDRPEHVRQATLVSHSLRRIDQAVKDGQLKFGAAEKLRQPQIRDLLILIDDIEIRPQLPVAS